MRRNGPATASIAAAIAIATTTAAISVVTVSSDIASAFVIPSSGPRFAISSPAVAVRRSFHPPLPSSSSSSRARAATMRSSSSKDDDAEQCSEEPLRSENSLVRCAKFAWRRADTLRAAGFYDDDLEDGSKRLEPLVQSTFRKGAILFAIGFLIKWYRARFITKIPVWDRQPQWGMVITSKEQEKDLKAYTCKNCGSTIFIAKGREGFFGGDRGLKGLGCFNCGAKGEDNFIDDRERIVDEADDDYFDYERPLDFVTRAERRQLLKEAGGDEEKANLMLVEKAAESAGLGGDAEESIKGVKVEKEEEGAVTGDEDIASEGTEGEPAAKDDGATIKKKKKKKKRKKKKKAPAETNGEDAKPKAVTEDDVDELDMDAL